jgi:hypothetical protein
MKNPFKRKPKPDPEPPAPPRGVSIWDLLRDDYQNKHEELRRNMEEME